MKEQSFHLLDEDLKAVLDGRQRLLLRSKVLPQPKGETLNSVLDGRWLSKKFNGLALPRIKDLPIHCPYGQVGDHVWVRECWKMSDIDSVVEIAYMADDQKKRVAKTDTTLSSHEELMSFSAEFTGWIPACLMPRWASRIWLEITDIRVERLELIIEKGTSFNPWVWVVELRFLEKS